MKKCLANIALFIVGNPSQPIPTRAFMTYSVMAGRAKKDHLVYEVPDLDPNQIASELWADSVAQIKTIEGID